MSPAQMVTTMVGLLRARRHPAAVDRAARQRALEVTAFAGRAVPFYRDLYGGRSFTALEEVPFAEKEAMRRVPLTDRLAGPVPPGSRTLHTGGTTGAAFQTVFSPRFGRWQALLRTRTELERGWLRPWRRRATLSFGGQDRPRSGLASTAVFGRYCHLALEAPAAELAAAVVACRPAVLSGHPHRLLDVGLLLPRGARPRIATHGETLEPSLLAALTDVYGVRPLDWYGTAEVGALASQCRRADLYHVQNDSVVVEVLDPGGEPVPPGGTGDMVVTGLHNALMPMVRYRQRDRVTLADRPCACGYAGPCLAAVVGRSSDFAVGAGRERISPERLWLFTHLDSELVARFVRRYQVRQVASGEIRVLVELREALPDGLRDDILRSYRTMTCGQPVSLLEVDDLGEDRPGKFRIVQSDLAASLPRS